VAEPGAAAKLVADHRGVARTLVDGQETAGTVVHRKYIELPSINSCGQVVYGKRCTVADME